ncbi:unnamed protein product [Ostreobium quekettii]|uniref:RAP domain-containing protein n=1 Tax=Ostreobium quekettii TaxID=121088 RepID=A0A8S1IQJ2_9CHLO|nr:unnamed protein product [Ostreobium quekettii]
MPRLRSQLLDNVVQEAVLRQPSQFSASELSTFVHSLASLHHEDILSSTAMDLCTLSAIRRSEQFRAHEMVDVVWSYTQIFGHHHDPQVLDTMAKLLVPRLGEITHVPRLVILVKAFADLDLHYTDLHNEVSALLCPHLECLDQGLVVELLQAFGHVHHYSSTLFERAATVLSDSKSRLSTSQLASVLQLYGCMMHDPGQAALDVWLTQLQDLGRAALTSSQVCSVLWSLALLEALSPELFLQLSRDIQDCRKGDFTVSDIERLLMAEWLLEITCRRQGQTPPRIPRPLRLQILSVWRERLYYKHDVSSFQKDVGLTLTDMRISHTLEESVENGDFKIDYVIVGDGNARVALECDGPRRFTSNAPYHALGETVASRRVLEGRGWRVVSISKHAWNSLKSREEKQSFLEQELWGIGC